MSQSAVIRSLLAAPAPVQLTTLLTRLVDVISAQQDLLLICLGHSASRAVRAATFRLVLRSVLRAQLVSTTTMVSAQRHA